MYLRTPVIPWEKPKHLIFIQSLIMWKQSEGFSVTSRSPPPPLIWVWAMTTPQSSPSYIRFDFWSSTLIIKVFIFLIIKDKKTAGWTCGFGIRCLTSYPLLPKSSCSRNLPLPTRLFDFLFSSLIFFWELLRFSS